MEVSVQDVSPEELNEYQKANLGAWLRYVRCSEGRVSYTGALIGIKTVNETTYWVHAEDIVGIEDSRPYEMKMFVRGKTSPVHVVVNVHELSDAITSIRNSRKDVI